MKHVALYRFKEGVTEEQKNELFQMLRNNLGTISVVKEFNLYKEIGAISRFEVGHEVVMEKAEDWEVYCRERDLKGGGELWGALVAECEEANIELI